MRSAGPVKCVVVTHLAVDGSTAHTPLGADALSAFQDFSHRPVGSKLGEVGRSQHVAGCLFLSGHLHFERYGPDAELAQLLKLFRQCLDAHWSVREFRMVDDRDACQRFGVGLAVAMEKQHERRWCRDWCRRWPARGVGQRLVQLRANAQTPEARVRRPRPPGERFVAHTLAVTELYVALVELGRISRFTLDDFQAEPMAWWPNGLGEWLKPDAFVKIRLGADTDYWWYEADLATESLPTVRGKLNAYLDFVRRGQLGPDGITPRVLIGVPGRARQMAIQGLVYTLPEPAEDMFRITELVDAATALVRELTNW
jgi:hypothetical protein